MEGYKDPSHWGMFLLWAKIILESIEFPDPVISVAVEPKTKADQEKMGIALQKLGEEKTIATLKGYEHGPAGIRTPDHTMSDCFK